MARYAAFLRGMNLGGRRIGNAELCAHVAALGFGDVRALRASGNLALTAADAEPGAVARRLEDGLAAALGYDVPAFVRSAAKLQAIAAREPFPAGVVASSAGKLQVAFLGGPPGSAARARALALQTDDDRLAIAGTELYWLPSGGVGRSELDQAALAAALGAMTVRTIGTVRALAAMLAAEPSG